MPQWLDEITPIFPPLSTANNEGLLTIGGNLTVETLVSAYQQGIFPWFEQGSPILWWSPNPRLVLYPENFHVSKSLRRTLRNSTWRISLNTAFCEVISSCVRTHSLHNKYGDTWITTAMYEAYIALHAAGFAHSVEVFENHRLIGGLYGVAIGKIFFGESMFSLVNNASKVALYYLCAHLQQNQFPLIDCQVKTAHLISLGAKEIPRGEFAEYVWRLTQAESKPQIWSAQTLSVNLTEINCR